MLPPRRLIAPALAVIAGALALQLAYGASAWDALLYLAYEAGFVLLPGWVAYRALSSRPGGAIRQLAFGWAVGYVLEILAFMATAAAGVRPLLSAYPLVVLALGLPAIRRRGASSASGRRSPLPQRFEWYAAAVCLGAMAYIAIAFFPTSPLPGTESFNYFQDYPWALSIAAEAKHHWPIEDPNVSGEPLPYHYFVHIHWAAASTVTGIGLPEVYFRLAILPLAVAIVLAAVAAGHSLIRSYGAGLIAACLILFVGELQLDTTLPGAANVPFLGVLFTLMITSPSFLFGLVFFLPLLALIGERARAPGEPWRWGDWAVLALLAIGAAQAKVSILPVLVGAMVLYAVSIWAATRRIPAALWVTGSVLVAVSAVFYLSVYRGHSSGLGLDLTAGFDYFTNMPAVSVIESHLLEVVPDFPGEEPLLSTGAVLLGLAGLLAAQLIGVVWALRRGARALGAEQRWLLAVLATGLAFLIVFDGGGSGNQIYGFLYGLAGGCILSAGGLADAWRSRPEMRGSTARVTGAAAAAALLLAAVFVVPVHLDLGRGDRYVLWYGGLIAALAVIYLVGRRVLGPSRWPAAILVCGGILAVGALDKPVDTLKPGLFDLRGETAAGRRVTPDLYRALEWVRDETPNDAVVAVNSHFTATGPFEFVYGGFGERRVFLEGWGYSARSREIGYGDVAAGQEIPFPGRLALNEAVFEQGSRRAMRTLARRYGVRYLIVDEVNGYPADPDAIEVVADVAYRGDGVIVFELPRT